MTIGLRGHNDIESRTKDLSYRSNVMRASPSEVGPPYAHRSSEKGVVVHEETDGKPEAQGPSTFHLRYSVVKLTQSSAICIAAVKNVEKMNDATGHRAHYASDRQHC